MGKIVDIRADRKLLFFFCSIITELEYEICKKNLQQVTEFFNISHKYVYFILVIK